MGRHGEHGENAPRGRGKPEPESAPEPVTRDEPTGRRLRPEESAITEPPEGFLGSGWSATTQLSDPLWPDEERRPGGRVKMALLAVAAVIVVLGGTVMGIQAMSGPAGSATDCSPGQCLAGASNRPEPYIPLTEPADGPPPAEEPPAPEDSAGTTSAPAPAPTPQRAGRTSGTGPRPTPTATRTSRRPQPAHPSGGPRPTPSATGESVVTDTRTHAPAVTTEPSATAEPTADPSAASGTPAPVGGAAVTVGFGLVKEKEQLYTAELVVAAQQRLDRLTLSVPVGGRVASVSGADWRQTGHTLVIESVRALDAGENLVVTFTAYGEVQPPRTCQSTQGDCVMT